MDKSLRFSCFCIRNRRRQEKMPAAVLVCMEIKISYRLQQSMLQMQRVLSSGRSGGSRHRMQLWLQKVGRNGKD